MLYGHSSRQMSNVCQMLRERLGARQVEIPESMKAPNMRLIHLPRFKGYTINFVRKKSLSL